MSVVETPPTERPPQTAAAPQQQLTITSVVGALLLLGGLWLIFGGLPYAWGVAWDSIFAENKALRENTFLSLALLVLVDLAVIGGLAYLAYLGLQKQTQPGARAGIIAFALAIFLTLWIGVWLGHMLEAGELTAGWAVVLLVMAAMLAGVGYLFYAVPAWLGILEYIEGMGWFHGTEYKGNQGVRVRRGTIMGIIAIGAFGIYVLVTRKAFGPSAETSTNWEWILPFAEDPNRPYFVPLMYEIHLIIPVILGALLLFASWRIVNIPTAADFLIATEAEMNKVSWTSRSRLIQDTIVVLTTVFLFTAFLFAIDVVWIKVLGAPFIKVLLVDAGEEKAKQQEKAQW